MDTYLLSNGKVGLAFAEAQDAPLYSKWLTNSQLRAVLGMCNINTSISSERSFIEQQADFLFTIYDIKTGTAVGVGSLFRVNQINQTCEMGIFIGESSFRKKGLGYDAANLLIKYAFESLFISNILIHIEGGNNTAISLAKKLGFTMIGKRRDCFRIGRKLMDDYLFDMTYLDFTGQRGE